MDNSKYYDLELPPCISIQTIIVLSHKKVSFMVIINMKVYKRINLKRDHVTHLQTFVPYIYIHIIVCMYVYVYVYM